MQNATIYTLPTRPRYLKTDAQVRLFALALDIAAEKGLVRPHKPAQVLKFPGGSS